MKCVCVYLDGARIQRRTKRVMAPGGMEQVTLESEVLGKYSGLLEIRICTEAE